MSPCKNDEHDTSYRAAASCPSARHGSACLIGACNALDAGPIACDLAAQAVADLGDVEVEFGEAMVSFVASHLELKNTLARAKEEMDAAAKAAQEEARIKAKNLKKPSKEPVKKVELEKKEEPNKEPELRGGEPLRSARSGQSSRDRNQRGRRNPRRIRENDDTEDAA